MPFQFTQLPTELALNIIHLAALSSVDQPLKSPRPYYSTALSLSLVSSAVRRATMPYLLHTVVLSSSSHLLAFIESILIQRNHRSTNSRLSLDYTRLVRRLWSTECWEPVVDEEPDHPLNYSALYEIIRGVKSLGLDFRSLHLLYNGLASANANPTVDWECRQVTLAGPLWRWRPLTSTTEGMAFLTQITHLVLWIPNHETLPVPVGRLIPHWVEYVPFNLMKSLTHFACPLLRNRKQLPGRNASFAPTEMVIYTVPPAKSAASSLIREWVLGGDPLQHGIPVSLDLATLSSDEWPEGLIWELAYLQGEGDGAWARAEKVK